MQNLWRNKWINFKTGFLCLYSFVLHSYVTWSFWPHAKWDTFWLPNGTFNVQRNGQGELARHYGQLFQILNAATNQKTPKKFCYRYLDPLTPKRNKYLISLYINTTECSIKVWRIKGSKVPWEMYKEQDGEYALCCWGLTTIHFDGIYNCHSVPCIFSLWYTGWHSSQAYW